MLVNVVTEKFVENDHNKMLLIASNEMQELLFYSPMSSKLKKINSSKKFL